MQTPSAVYMDIVLLNVAHQVQVAFAVLFASLKVQHHIAFQLFGIALQDLGSTHQHGGVGIVTAGMGNAGVLTQYFLGEFVVAGGFLHVQGVDVCPQQHSFARLFAPDKAQNTAVGHIDTCNAQLVQMLQDHFHRVLFLLRQLCVFMKMLLPGDHLRLDGQSLFENIHRENLLACLLTV